MPFTSKKSLETRSRNRANRSAGRVWLVIFFFFLAVMNLANSTIQPMLGTMAPFFRAGLIVATVWYGILLAAIGCGHGWARYLLIGFLFAVVVAEILFLVHIFDQHPSLRGQPVQLVAIVLAAHVVAAAYLIFSADIRQIAHHVID